MRKTYLILPWLALSHAMASEPVDTCIQINEVEVTGLTGTTKMKYSPMSVTVVRAAQLRRTSSVNIIDALAAQPGLSQVTTGSGVSKPVIRGLGYNRVVVVNDGVRQEGQQWGDEHGVEIDPQAVSSAEVIKGPASLRYGSDAMAGVLIFHAEPRLPIGSVAGTLSTEYQSNSGLFGGSLALAGHPGTCWWSLRYSEKAAHAYRNPRDGYVLGTQFHERAFTGATGLSGHWGSSSLKLGYYHLTPSIVEGDRDEESGSFVRPVMQDGKPAEVVATHSDLTTYGHGMPYQQVYHAKVVLDNTVYLGEGSLKAIVAYQHNRRREYEEVETPHDSGLDFLLHTFSYDLHYDVQFPAGWQGVVGLGGMFQRSLNKGDEYLIPAYRLFDVGLFVTASHNIGSWHLSGGLRVDRRHLHSYRLADEEEETYRFSDFSRRFAGVTGSIGAVCNLTHQWNLRFNLSRGFRAPNINELGANGKHEGTLRYEVGNHSLHPEYSWQLDVGGDYSSSRVSAQLALFANRIDHYIYLAAKPDADIGTDVPVYAFSAGDALLIGGEFSSELHPWRNIHVENDFSCVLARQFHQPRSSRYLPFTPAPRWTCRLCADLPQGQRSLAWIHQPYVAVGHELTWAQNRYYEAGHTESATPSYFLLRASAGADLWRRGHHVASVTLMGDNLLNRAYQSHLSRLKYAPVNPVTGHVGICNMGRNLSLRIIFYLFG